MKSPVIPLVIVFLSLAAANARAQVSIKAEVDKASITTDELLTYKLTVASTEKNIPEPSLPAFEGFAVVSQAQSSTVSFQKGGMQSILVFAFILLPKDAGAAKIEPARITVRQKTYTSESFVIQIKQGVLRQHSIPDTKPPLDQRSPQTTPMPEEPDQPKYTL